jgi:hypothetical protein
MSKNKAYSEVVGEVFASEIETVKQAFLAAVKGKATKNPHKEGTPENRAWTHGIACFHEKRIPLYVEDLVPLPTYDKRYVLSQAKYFEAACATFK